MSHKQTVKSHYPSEKDLHTQSSKTSIINGPFRPDLLREESLASVFRETARQQKEKPALIFNERQITYSEVDLISDQLALQLQEMVIGSGDFVGVYLPRGIELHLTILAIVKSGAAYVPMDYDTPTERVTDILNEVNAKACFTDKDVSLPVKKLMIDLSKNPETNRFSLPPVHPDSCAYVIYTSGSTGKPKGIPITHRQICHLVRAEQSVLQIDATDRVYQGFSVSFDMWCEETWISYLVGATLWIADSITSKSINELPDVLEKNRISVLHAVPSLLAAVPHDAATVRLVNAGGESCTPLALEKWTQRPRKFFNSYGPTETTVSASMAGLSRDDKITIGKLLPNYSLAVVNENMEPVFVAEEGELVISGIGVSQGYIKRPALTQQKFLEKPANLASMYGTRIYRTGDLVKLNNEKNIEFLGRIDDQVKLHGYRIELGDIESRLLMIQGLADAAIKLIKEDGKKDWLAAFVCKAGDAIFDEHQSRKELARHLPPYMIPSGFILVNEIPRLPSGKINRKQLQVPDGFLLQEAVVSNKDIDSLSGVEQKVKAILEGIFPGKEISMNEDFFNDLGGDSFTSALFVSEVRDKAKIESASFKDVYTLRPLHKLIANWQEQEAVISKEEVNTIQEIPQQRSNLSYIICSVAQTASLFVLYALFALQLFLPFMAYSYVFVHSRSHVYGVITAFAMFCLLIPLFYMLGIMVKRLVLGRIREGDYPLWGTYYFRWWLVKSFQKLNSVQFIADTPLYPVYLRAMGMKIGENAQLSSLTVGAEDLVSLGDNVSISSAVMIDNAWIEGNCLKIRKVSIGSHCYVGNSTVLGGDTCMSENAELGDLSFLPYGKTVPANELWKGSPAVFDRTKENRSATDMPFVSTRKKLTYTMVFSALLLLLPLAFITPLLPTIIVLNEQNHHLDGRDYTYLWLTPLFALSYVLVFLVQTIISSRLFRRKLKPGVYSIYSGLYVSKWLNDQLMNISLNVLHPIYATIFAAPMFRSFGATVGKKTEISTAGGVTHSLLSIGEGGFVADAVNLGEVDVRDLKLTLKTTSVGNMTFLGNASVIPQGSDLESDLLIGVLSTPPSKEEISSTGFRSWVGSPPIGLPRRQEPISFPENLTINPSRARKWMRGTVEFLRVLAPLTVITLLSMLFITFGHALLVDHAWWHISLLFPLYYIGIIGLPSFLFTVAAKWLLVGRYKAKQLPMWTPAVWKSEAVTTTYEALAVPYLLEFMEGTCWLPMLLRLMGTKIGKRVCMLTTDITEHDMVSIGDDSVLNVDCGPQTHLFEDRIMKIGPVSVGDRCTVGARTIILYNSRIETKTVILPLSLVMKGETLAGNKRWCGSPVKITPGY